MSIFSVYPYLVNMSSLASFGQLLMSFEELRMQSRLS